MIKPGRSSKLAAEPRVHSSSAVFGSVVGVVAKAVVVPFALMVVVSAGMLIPAELYGQTVFLPTVRGFSFSGSASVPDGGTIQLGGVNTSSEQANSAGVPGLSNIPGFGRGFNNRGIGREQTSGKLTAKVQILDMKELEAEHLAKAGYVPGAEASNAEVLRKAAFLSKHVGRRGNSGSSQSGRDRE